MLDNEGVRLPPAPAPGPAPREGSSGALVQMGPLGSPLNLFTYIGHRVLGRTIAGEADNVPAVDFSEDT